MRSIYDAIIVGGGAAGSSAALALGRARRKVAVFDNDTNRNRVTHESHNFLTRDNTKPETFREIAHQEFLAYPSVELFKTTVKRIEKVDQFFIIHTGDEELFHTKKIILATGVQETFNPPDIQYFYGKSLFNCPYCDGWELRDQPLAIISNDSGHLTHLFKLLYNWSKDLVLFSNGTALPNELATMAGHKNVPIYEQEIEKLVGDKGVLEAVQLKDGTVIKRTAGFVVPQYKRSTSFAADLGCSINKEGLIELDGFQRTSVDGVYVAGEEAVGSSLSLVISAAEGHKTATILNGDLSEEEFQKVEKRF